MVLNIFTHLLLVETKYISKFWLAGGCGFHLVSEPVFRSSGKRIIQGISIFCIYIANICFLLWFFTYYLFLNHFFFKYSWNYCNERILNRYCWGCVSRFPPHDSWLVVSLSKNKLERSLYESKISEEELLTIEFCRPSMWD